MSETRPTKVHRVALLVIDTDDLGAEEVVEVIESTRYPNYCIAPDVLGVETREVEWHDEHPLNRAETFDAAVADLFGATVTTPAHEYTALLRLSEHTLDSIGAAVVGARIRGGLTLRHDPSSGCRRCPMRAAEPNYDRAYHRCDATAGDIGDMDGPAPEWCPLRSGPVVVERTGGEG